jgi:hypothetical protein
VYLVIVNYAEVDFVSFYLLSLKAHPSVPFASDNLELLNETLVRDDKNEPTTILFFFGLIIY